MSSQLRKKTIAYSFGQLGAGLYGGFNIFTLPLYLSQFTTNNVLIGWLSSTRSFEQSIIQPLVGAASDRTRTPLGRRAPFFLTTMPMVALLFVITAWIPHAPAYLGLVVISIFLFSLLFNVGIDPYYALLVDVMPAHHRGTANGIAQVAGAAGAIVVLIVAAVLWNVHPAWVFYFVAAGLVTGFGIVALGVREGPAPVRFRRQSAAVVPGSQPGRAAQRGRMSALAHYLRQLYRVRREALKLLGARFLYEFGINAALPFLTLFSVQEVGLNGWSSMVEAFPLLRTMHLDSINADELSQLIAAFLLLVSMLSASLSGFLGDRFGKKKVFALGLLLLGVFSLFAASATSVPQLLFYLIWVGIGNGARNVLFGPFLADLIPAARAGEFTGLSALAETGGVFVAVIVAGALINLNPFGLHYRTVFLLTGLFVLLGLVAVGFVRPRPQANATDVKRRLIISSAEPA